MFLDLELIIRNAVVVTASDQFASDIGIKDGKITILAAGIPSQEGCREIDAEGGFVTPGGVDSHVHIAQSAAKGFGARSADDWTSGTMSALAGLSLLPISRVLLIFESIGGTTTILAFAVQGRGASLTDAVNEYHKKSDKYSVCDYGYHLIVTDPNEVQMHTELPKLVKQGISSMKVAP
jgi:dihydropyrimidinase